MNDIIEDPRKAVSNALVELGAKNDNVLYISCDSSLGASGGEFNKRFPERHFEFGIAEQNGMGEAAGFALSGKIPFIAAYVPFITFRCFEQIRDDVCKTKLNVNIMGNNCGFSVSTLGPPHLVLEDVGVLRSIPNMTILSPCDAPEYYQAIFAAAEIPGPVYIRIHREKVKRVNNENYKFVVGKATVLKKGRDVSMITCSSMVPKTLEAAGILTGKGIDAEVINMPTLKPVDREAILESGLKTGWIITVEEHSIVNGLGTAVADVIVNENSVRMKMIGIEDVFSVVGNYKELTEYYGLTGPGIAAKTEEFLKRS